MENPTILARKTVTQARQGAGTFPPYGDAGSYTDPTETG